MASTSVFVHRPCSSKTWCTPATDNGARNHNGTDVCTHAFQLFEGLDRPNPAGSHADEPYEFTRQHRGEPEILDDELGHRTKAAMVFGCGEDDSGCRRNRGAETLPIPDVGIARERERQRAGIEHERI